MQLGDLMSGQKSSFSSVKSGNSEPNAPKLPWGPESNGLEHKVQIETDHTNENQNLSAPPILDPERRSLASNLGEGVRKLTDRDYTHNQRKVMNERISKGLVIGGDKRLQGETTDLLSDKNGLVLADKIFRALSENDHKAITVNSFYNYFETQEEADEAFSLFDRDGSGTLDYSEVTRTIVRIYRERRNLLRSLGDCSYALGQLNNILYVISGMLFFMK